MPWRSPNLVTDAITRIILRIRALHGKGDARYGDRGTRSQMPGCRSQVPKMKGRSPGPIPAALVEFIPAMKSYIILNVVATKFECLVTVAT